MEKPYVSMVTRSITARNVQEKAYVSIVDEKIRARNARKVGNRTTVFFVGVRGEKQIEGKAAAITYVN